VEPIVDKIDDLVQYLECNNVPYGQWGKNVHILANRAKDTGFDSSDTGFDGGDFDSSGGDFGGAPERRRMDYGRFDWAKASSLDTEDEDNSDDEMETSSSAAPSLDDILRRPQLKAPRFGITEARRKTQNKLDHWSDFITSVSETAGSEATKHCSCVKVMVSLPAISLSGM
jgi:hypothetical protein